MTRKEEKKLREKKEREKEKERKREREYNLLTKEEKETLAKNKALGEKLQSETVNRRKYLKEMSISELENEKRLAQNAFNRTKARFERGLKNNEKMIMDFDLNFEPTTEYYRAFLEMDIRRDFLDEVKDALRNAKLNTPEMKAAIEARSKRSEEVHKKVENRIIMAGESVNFDNKYLEEIIAFSYEELVNSLQKKYGEVLLDYDKGQEYPPIMEVGNRFIHHVDENIIADLSKELAKKVFPQFQKKERLVYCNLLEHIVLHILIAGEDPKHTLGLGGLINHDMLWALEIKKTLSEKDFNVLLKILYMKTNSLDTTKSFEIFDKQGKISSFTSYYNFLLKYEGSKFSYYNPYSTQEQLNVYNDIISKFDKGLTEVSKENILPYIKNSLLAIKATNERYFIFRSESDFIIILSAKGKQVYYWQGGLRRKTTMNFNEMEIVMKEATKNLINIVNIFDKMLKPISEYCKLLGFDGYIHGTIIDLDDVTHIRIGRDGVLIPYITTEKTDRVIFKNLPELILEKYGKEKYSLIENSKTSLALISGVGFEHNLPLGNNNDENFYDKNIEVYEAQCTAETKLFRIDPMKFYKPSDDKKLITDGDSDKIAITDNAEKLLSELEKELKMNRNNFGDKTILYTYYAFDGEYEEYSMTVKYFLYNFSIIKNANKIMEKWLEERSQKGYVDHLMEFLIQDYCPTIEIYGGDPIFSEEE